MKKQPYKNTQNSFKNLTKENSLNVTELGDKVYIYKQNCMQHFQS